MGFGRGTKEIGSRGYLGGSREDPEKLMMIVCFLFALFPLYIIPILGSSDVGDVGFHFY